MNNAMIVGLEIPMRTAVALLGLLLLGACGGGGGGGGGSQRNLPPAITSAAAISVPENVAGTVHQATATDPNGDPITFRMDGQDGARFTITSAGALSFIAPPDFEAPGDADRNNVYQISIIANDGLADTRQDLSITVTNVADAVTLRQISGFVQPRAVTPAPGSGRIFVAEQGGRIYLTDPTQPGPGTLYLTVAGLSATRGLQNIVAAPDYATSGRLYVFLVNAAGEIEIRRYGRLGSGLGDPASADTILRISMAAPHIDIAGGGLAFGPDGNLYLGIGEGTGLRDNTAQDLTLLLGKLLRIDVSRDDFPADVDRDYGIPTDNPFTTGAREIYAYGLENPRRMNFEGPSLLISDAHVGTPSLFGQNQEINLLGPPDAGANFGFPQTSGVQPVLRWAGTSLSGTGLATLGFVYRGPAPQFTGLLFFSDSIKGVVWTVPASSIVQGTTIPETGFTRQNAALGLPEFPGIMSFGTDASNNLYLVPNNSPFIYLLELR